MSRRVLKSFLYLGVMFLFAASVAFAQKAKTLDIYTDAVLPNGQELKAGKYQVAIDEAGKEVKFLKRDKVVASHTCKVVDKADKNSCNEVRYSAKEDKQQIQELRFGGERRSILLIESGM